MRKIIALVIMVVMLSALACGGATAAAPPDNAPTESLLEQSGISEYGFQAAANFLRDFDSIFTGFDPAEFNWTDDDLIDGTPWIHSLRRELDDGWVWPQHYYAASFDLYDFDGDGMPEILVHYNTIHEEGYVAFSHLFRYMNGEYRRLEIRSFENGAEAYAHLSVAHDFFWDEDGRIITFVWLPEPHAWVQYDRLVIVDTYAELHLVLAMPDEVMFGWMGYDRQQWQAWEAHHWQEWGFTQYGRHRVDGWMYHNPTIFGTDITLTLIRPFTDLAAEIRAYLLTGNPAIQPAEADRQSETYTIEQIQAALQMQFTAGDWGEGNPQVISAQRVERDIDYIIIEAAGPYPVDLTNSSQYRVQIRFRQSLGDFNFWYAENSPFRREGDYTIFTTHYFFNDVDGEPVLAFILC